MFEIDALRLKASVLHALSQQARSVAEWRSVAEQSLRLLDAAMVKDRFDLAPNLVDMAVSTATESDDIQLRRRIRLRAREVEEICKTYADFPQAVTVLENNPTDPEANLKVGRYRCFVKGDWETGLPMLALGSDPQIKAVAIRELEQTTGNPEHVETANAWWDLAEKQQEAIAKKQYWSRAAYWYRRALPGLTGLIRATVQKRLESVEQDTVIVAPTEAATKPPPATPRPPKTPPRRLEYFLWEWRPSGGKPFKLKLYVDGGVGKFGNKKHRWTRKGNRIDVHWPQGWVDRMTVSPDGRSMKGKNQHGRAITARFLGTNLNE
jgi:hypothetical protein